MTTIQASPLLLPFAAALVLLVYKAQILGAATAATRGKLGQFITQEDAEWLGGEYAFPDAPEVRRLGRMHMNDLEALVPFLIVGSLYLVSGASQTAGLVYFSLFPLVRLVHSFAYATRRPRLRRDAFATGWLINFVIGGHALWAIVEQNLA
jgi:glutathione S-transferase